MKILLAMLSSEPTSRYAEGPDSPYAIGLGYIHSVLESEGHDVKMLPLSNNDEESSDRIFFETYDSFGPDIVGFSVFSSNRVSTFRTIEKLTMLRNPPHMIIGGIHASMMYEQIIKKYPRVIAVIGEGELTVVELAKALESNRPLDGVKGIAFYKNGQVNLTGERELIEDLDSLPFPKHEVFFDSQPMRTSVTFFTSRGCPFKCSFCCTKIISKSKCRRRNVDKVMEEIVYLKNKYPRIKYMKIQDDNFLLDNARVIELCKLIVDAKLGIEFGCLARVKPISPEMFYWMKKAGFTSLEFGLETGSEKLLKSIRKSITREDVINLVKTVEPFNFKVFFLVMCGFPGEDDGTIRDSVSFIQSVQREYYVRVLHIAILELFPGSEIYETAKRNGFINDDYWLTDKRVPYYTAEHDIRRLTYYENYILNRVAIRRIFTPRGFVLHFLRMPSPIIKHLSVFKEDIPTIVSWPLRSSFPRLYAFLAKTLKPVYYSLVRKSS